MSLRRLLHLSVFVSAILISSCSGNSYRRSLLVADSLCCVDPHQSLDILDSIRGEMASASEHERMYYNLLCIKAADKAYIDHKSDSLILPLIDYYEKHSDRKFLAEAYYYAGSVYRDMNDATMALDYFQKALDEMPGDDNLRMKSNTCYQTGLLFFKQSLHDEAIEAYKKAYRCDSILKDTVQMADCYRVIAVAYTSKSRKDSSFYYYEMAYDIAKKSHNHSLELKVLGQMADFYISEKNYVKANECLQPVLYASSTYQSSHYSMMSDIYMGRKQYDSAYSICKKILESGSIYAKQDASRKLAKITSMNGRYDEMRHYLDLYEIYMDSVFRITATESVAQMNALYNYQIREKENIELKVERSRHIIIIILVVVFFCIVFVSFIVYCLRFKRKRLRLELQIRTLEQIKKEMFEQSQIFINNNKEKIKELETKLRMACDANNELTNKIIQQKADLVFANEKAERNIKKNNIVTTELFSSKAYKIVRNKIEQGKILTAKDWTVIDDIVNEVVNTFKVRLYSLCHLSEHEYHICLLIRLGCNATEISSLLSRSPSAITLARKRLYFKLFKEDGTGTDLDDFVKSL